MKYIREWLLFKGVMRIIKRNNRMPTTVLIRNHAVEGLVNKLRKKSFYCEVEEITTNFKKVHILSLLN